MAKTDKAPMFVRVANVLTLTLLRAGFPLVGPGLVIGNYPMYLLTVRGRKGGQLGGSSGRTSSSSTARLHYVQTNFNLDY